MRYTFIPIFFRGEEYLGLPGSGIPAVTDVPFTYRNIDGSYIELYDTIEYESSDLQNHYGPHISGGSLVDGSGILIPKVTYTTDENRYNYTHIHGIVNLYLGTSSDRFPWPLCDLYFHPSWRTASDSVAENSTYGPQEHHFISRIYSGYREDNIVYHFTSPIPHWNTGLFLQNISGITWASGVVETNLFNRGIV